jgi:hypothetical protein
LIFIREHQPLRSWLISAVAPATIKGLESRGERHRGCRQEKFQGVSILPEQQAHFQSGAALKNIFPQPPDGNPAMRVWMAEAAGNRLKRDLDAGEIRIAQMLERRVKARA